MHTCQIKWIDSQGEPTADTNPSIGRVRCKARVEQHHGRALSFSSSPWFHICAEHAKRMDDPGMDCWEWETPQGEAV